MNTLAANRGVTLVELVTAMVITMVAAGIILTMYNLFNREVTEGAANAILLMRMENVDDLMAREIRGANAVLRPEPHEYWDAEANSLPATEQTATTIVLYDAEGRAGNRYRIHDDKLQEQPAEEAIWSDIQVGGEPVTVAAGGGFTLFAGRKSVALDITLTMGSHSLPFTGGTYRCRN